MEANEDISGLLQAWSDGTPGALDRLMPLVHEELRRSAIRAMAHERPEHTLEPGALVNEVYLKLATLKKVSWEKRTQFFAFAVRVMREVLVSYARKHLAGKRGVELNRISLDEAKDAQAEPLNIDVLDLDAALKKLEEFDPRMARLIELRFFGGLTEDEAAEALGVSRPTVQRDWVVAKRFLAQELRGVGANA